MMIYKECLELSAFDEEDFARIASSGCIGPFATHLLTLYRQRRDSESELCYLCKNCAGEKSIDNMFHCGKILYERKYDEQVGLQMLNKAVKDGSIEAQKYLFDIYAKRNDWKKALEYKRLFADESELVRDIIHHPEVLDSWARNLVQRQLWKGYLRDCHNPDDKVLFVTFYIGCISSDPTAIAEALPDHRPWFLYIGLFFESLPEDSKNPHILYFVAYNYFFGISCREDMIKGLRIVKSIRKESCNRDVMGLVITLISLGRVQCHREMVMATLYDAYSLRCSHELALNIALVGGWACGKTALVNRMKTGLFTNPKSTLALDYETHKVNEYGKEIYLRFWDTCGNETMRSFCKHLERCQMMHCFVMFWNYGKPWNI